MNNRRLPRLIPLASPFRLVTLGTLSVALLTLPARAQLSPDQAARIDQAAAQVLSATGVPSASIAVVEDSKIVYLHAYGKAHLQPPLDATQSMQYSIGSISKQFTAAAIMLLVQEHKLSLDDPIGKFLPTLTRANEVTVRMVLSHTSGYQDYWPEDYVMTSMLVPTTAQHILDVWAKKPLDFDPGTRWQYSNTNYVIAGRIVEQISGDSLMHFLQTRIFTPLGMTGVLNSDAAHLPPNDPYGYQRYALGPPRVAPDAGTGWMFAAGELAMMPRDLALWNIGILKQSVLQPASYAEMFKPVPLKDGTSSGYGLGFFIRDHNGTPVYEHSGEVSGFVSENVVFPQQKVAITVLTNEMATPAAGMLAHAIAPMLLGPTEGTQSPAEKQALDILTALQAGHVDRKLFTDYCNAYFSKEAIDDFAASLSPLCKPVSISTKSEELRGGMTFRTFAVQFANPVAHPTHVTISTYVMPDGKLEQFLVEPAS